ncbi:hypothetical protein X801_10118, partial [Opisthorchis viverrini]
MLRSLLGDQLVTDEVLMTVLTEVEKIINDRPLTKLSDDPLDLGALTPNHLLLLQGNPSVVSSPGSNTKLTRRWRQAQQLADTFWVRWIKEYLPTLHQRHKWVGSGRDLK